MHPTALFHALTVLGSVLVSASPTNIDPSSGTTDSVTRGGAGRLKYKRKGTTTVLSAHLPNPENHAVGQNHALAVCHGDLPPPHTRGNAQQAAGFASLLDWCIRGPAQCGCVQQASRQAHEFRCALTDELLDTVPGVVACYNHCDCGEPVDRTTLEALATYALQMGRARAGVA